MKLLQAAVVFCLLVRIPLFADNLLVLPFFNLSGDNNLEWVGESISETLRDALAAEGILTRSRDERQEAYRRLSIRPHTQLTRATVLRIADFLDAERVIFGQFSFTPPEGDAPKTQGSIRISAQVVNLRKATRGPEYSEIGQLADLARLQTHLAWQTIHYVNPDSAVTEADFRSRRPAIRVEAIENYTRGLLATEPEQKMKLLTQAVRLDPRYSPASFELGRLYLQKKYWRMAADHLKRVEVWDIRHREANFLLGLAWYRLGEFEAAEKAWTMVAVAVPLNEVWNNLGAAQSRTNSPEALANLQKALEGDPGDPDYHFNVGLALFRRGELEKAAERFRAVLDRDPGDAEAISMLGRSLKPGARAAAGDPGERLKENYEESAWLQLKAVLNPKR